MAPLLLACETQVLPSWSVAPRLAFAWKKKLILRLPQKTKFCSPIWELIFIHHPLKLLTHMRSWVMGKFPSAAARWRGVRASLGLTHEFTWIAILVTAFQKCHMGHYIHLHHSGVKTCNMVAYLFQRWVSQCKGHVSNVTPGIKNSNSPSLSIPA